MVELRESLRVSRKGANCSLKLVRGKSVKNENLGVKPTGHPVAPGQPPLAFGKLA